MKARVALPSRTLFLPFERGGEARSFHIDSVSVANVLPILRANLHCETALITDAAPIYRSQIGGEFASHDFVVHGAAEYARGDVTTNTVEGFYSIFERRMRGVYQHCSEKHLHRYLAEFDFRYSNRSALGVEDPRAGHPCPRRGQSSARHR